MTKYFTSSLLAFLFSLAYSQSPEWFHIPVTTNPSDISGSTDRVYVADHGLLAELDNSGAVLHAWTPFNSGLPAGTFKEVEVDAAGKVWASLGGNLVRWDGSAFATWDSTSSTLDGSDLVSMDVGPGGVVWVINDQGLHRFDGSAWSFWPKISIPACDTSSTLNSVSCDPVGNVWLAGPAGLDRFDGTSFSHWDDGNSPIVAAYCKWVHATNLGAIWVSNPPYLLRFDGSSGWEVHTFSGAEVGGMADDAAGNPYVAFKRSGLGLMHYNGSTWSNHSAPECNNYHSVWVAPSNSVWTGAYGASRIFKRSLGTWDEKNYLVKGIKLERFPLIAASGEHVFLAAASTFCVDTSFGVTKPFGSGDPDFMSGDGKGGAWVMKMRHLSGPYGALAHVDADTQRIVLTMPEIFAVSGSQDGSVYYNRSDNYDPPYEPSWYCLKGGVAQRLYPPVFPNVFTYAYVQDSNHVWFGDLGLWEYNPYSGGKWTMHTSLVCPQVTTDTMGNLVAVMGSHLMSYDGVSWSALDTIPLLFARSLVADGMNRLYLGNDSMLKVWESGIGWNDLLCNGLAISARGSARDMLGNLWFAGKDGIFVYQRDSVRFGLVPIYSNLESTLFPNPADEIASIQFELDHPQDCQVRLLDVLGRQVLEIDLGRMKQGVHEISIPLSELLAGTYLVTLTADDENVTRRLVKL